MWLKDRKVTSPYVSILVDMLRPSALNILASSSDSIRASLGVVFANIEDNILYACCIGFVLSFFLISSSNKPVQSKHTIDLRQIFVWQSIFVCMYIEGGKEGREYEERNWGDYNLKPKNVCTMRILH
mmetsp:Transcript_6555/g.9092  ORF Transcript_6555/g.9092 Transcript_6555/m.9092 type:complete len:127 (-) Transcript_6555:25-405(-)